MSGVPEAGNAGDTIFALASGPARAAISVIRLSGDRAGPILTGLCGTKPPPRLASLRSLRDGAGALLDRALVLWMPGPHSYTGEDTAELHLHGGRAVTQAVFAALQNSGARPADAGEFTKRAFLAGRMDLLEAEAIADLVSSETETQRIHALRNLEGGAGRQVAEWCERLTRCLAFQEALIDFPDEGLPDTVGDALSADIADILHQLGAHLDDAPAGERIRHGLIFAISGAPNVGKSSLFNAIAGRDAAIVSPVPGTTRDTLEVRLDLGGVAVTLVDTAGLRPSDDPIEAEGVRRARARADGADLILRTVDASDPSAAAMSGDANILDIANKIDLAPAPPGMLGVSTLTGHGLAALKAQLVQAAARLVHAEGHSGLSHTRHVAALRDTQTNLQRALVCALPELRAEELRLALANLGRLSGRVTSEAVLDVVFGAFCIGK